MNKPIAPKYVRQYRTVFTEDLTRSSIRDWPEIIQGVLETYPNALIDYDYYCEEGVLDSLSIIVKERNPEYENYKIARQIYDKKREEYFKWITENAEEAKEQERQEKIKILKARQEAIQKQIDEL